jgi:hypothetical protein
MVVGKKMAGVATLKFLSFQLKTTCKCKDKSRSPPGMTTRKANATTQGKCNNTRQMQQHKANATTQSKCNNTRQMQQHKANATTKQMQQQSECDGKNKADPPALRKYLLSRRMTISARPCSYWRGRGAK